MSDTVVVASKMSLRLRLYEFVDSTEGTPTGPRSVKVARQKGPDVVLSGPKRWRGEDLAKQPRQELHGGYALTTIDKDFWDKWCAQNSDSDLLRNKIVVAHSKDTASMAVEHKATRTGFEPLDMNTKDAKGRLTDPRLPKPLPGIAVIGTAGEGNQPLSAD